MKPWFTAVLSSPCPIIEAQWGRAVKSFLQFPNLSGDSLRLGPPVRKGKVTGSLTVRKRASLHQPGQRHLLHRTVTLVQVSVVALLRGTRLPSRDRCQPLLTGLHESTRRVKGLTHVMLQSSSAHTKYHHRAEWSSHVYELLTVSPRRTPFSSSHPQTSECAHS